MSRRFLPSPRSWRPDAAYLRPPTFVGALGGNRTSLQRLLSGFPIQMLNSLEMVDAGSSAGHGRSPPIVTRANNRNPGYVTHIEKIAVDADE